MKWLALHQIIYYSLLPTQWFLSSSLLESVTCYFIKLVSTIISSFCLSLVIFITVSMVIGTATFPCEYLSFAYLVDVSSRFVCSLYLLYLITGFLGQTGLWLCLCGFLKLIGVIGGNLCFCNLFIYCSLPLSELSELINGSESKILVLKTFWIYCAVCIWDFNFLCYVIYFDNIICKCIAYSELSQKQNIYGIKFETTHQVMASNMYEASSVAKTAATMWDY